MARETERLTAARVTKLAKTPTWKGPPRRRMVPDGNGLYLSVGREGNRSWILRYRLGSGKKNQHEHGLGSLALVGLAEARERALAARRKVKLDGIDVIAEGAAKDAARLAETAKAKTFAECAEAYIAAHRAEWSAKTATDWENSLASHAASIASLPVASVDTSLVLQVLEPLWHTKTETAVRLRAKIEAVLAWATFAGYRTGDNPARWGGHLEHTLAAPSKIKEKRHHAALDYRRMGQVMQQIRALSTLPAKALEFAILTATRTAEARDVPWGEIKLAERMWIIPASRMKAGKEHRVPLSDRAVELLQETGPGAPDERVFNVGTNALLDTAKRIDPTISAHGFRSTFSTWAHERTSYPNEIIEMALAHTVGTAVERAYQRSDLVEKRARLMADWAAFCDAPATSESAEVVPIRA